MSRGFLKVVEVLQKARLPGLAGQDTTMQSGTVLSVEEMIRLFRLLSHDLKSPIFSIDGFSELLLSDYGESLDEEGRDFLQRIRNGVGQMKSTLDGFSRTVKLLAEPNRYTEVDLDEVVEQVRLKLNYRAEEKGVEIEIEEGLPTVEADAEKLRELFRALISNAVEYSREDAESSKVTISHVVDDEALRVTVNDEGIGIDPQYHEQIFEAGLRLDKKSGAGSGCGLYLARRIAESHDGAIEVESDEGRGSRFTLRLPLSRISK